MNIVVKSFLYAVAILFAMALFLALVAELLMIANVLGSPLGGLFLFIMLFLAIWGLIYVEILGDMK